MGGKLHGERSSHLKSSLQPTWIEAALRKEGEAHDPQGQKKERVDWPKGSLIEFLGRKKDPETVFEVEWEVWSGLGIVALQTLRMGIQLVLRLNTGPHGLGPRQHRLKTNKIPSIILGSRMALFNLFRLIISSFPNSFPFFLLDSALA